MKGYARKKSIQYFRLSFGLSDSLPKIVREIQWLTSLPMDAGRDEIVSCLTEHSDDKNLWALLSMYSIQKTNDDFYIVLNPVWDKYQTCHIYPE